MRIAHVIAEMGAGGAEALVEDLALHRLARGDEVTVVSSGGRRADSLRENGARLVPLGVHRRSAARVLAGAVRVAPRLRGRYDVVHAHNVGAALVAHLALRWPLRRPPLVVTVHGLPAADYPRAAAILRRCADLVVAVSETERHHLVAAGLPPARVTVIDNGVTPLPAPDRAAARAALAPLGVEDDTPVALWVARLEPPKRPDLLLEAWRSLSHPGVLLVAGDGKLRTQLLQMQLLHTQLSETVRVLGERADVGALLAAADVYVLASDSEGMPMAVLEAMAAGVPVVATGVGGLVEGCAGAATLVPPDDAPALAAALTTVLTDESARARLAEAGRQRIAERFSAEAMRDAYDALYAAAVARSVR